MPTVAGGQRRKRDGPMHRPNRASSGAHGTKRAATHGAALDAAGHAHASHSLDRRAPIHCAADLGPCVRCHDGPLHVPAPFAPSAVISLAGIGDLESFARFVPLHCGAGILERLAPPGKLEVSPAALPPEAPVVMVSGILDRLVPPYVAHDYARALRGKRVGIRLVNIPDAGHFDLVTPSAPAWAEIRRLIETDLAVASTPREP